MADVLMIAVLVGFCVLCVLYVAWCDRIIGPDPASPSEPLERPEHEEVAT